MCFNWINIKKINKKLSQILCMCVGCGTFVYGTNKSLQAQFPYRNDPFASSSLKESKYESIESPDLMSIDEELAKEEVGKSVILDSYINIILCKVFRKIFVKENR